MGFAPGIKPGRVPFRYEIRPVPIVICIDQFLYFFHIIQSVNGRQHSRKVTSGHLGWAVAGIKIHIKPRFPVNITVPGKIFLVFIVRAVFILDLEQRHEGNQPFDTVQNRLVARSMGILPMSTTGILPVVNV